MNQDALDDIQYEINYLVTQYYQERHANKEFIPGVTPVPVSGKVFDEKEMLSLTQAMLDFWLTDGKMADEFSHKLAKETGRRYAVLCNSGSSANLLAITALAQKGKHVVTPAVGFPTTLNPIIQNGMIPVFVDVDLETYVPNQQDIEEAVDYYDSPLSVIPHTLGNPAVQYKDDNCTIYDSCDALGGTFDGQKLTKFGIMSTLSFYPAHQICLGEGGAVLTDDPKLKMKLESLCGWGRSCYCKTGHDNTCNQRFTQQFGDLPYGYDHKYVYSEIGYNLKMTDLQAAIGIPQLDKLPQFVKARQDNFAYLKRIFFSMSWDRWFYLPRPSSTYASPSWFGFPLTIHEDAPFTRLQLLNFLNEKKIGTRLLFGGNLTRQPAYKNTRYEIYGSLKNSDLITTNSFWIGVYPGLTRQMLDYVLECFEEFLGGSK